MQMDLEQHFLLPPSDNGVLKSVQFIELHDDRRFCLVLIPNNACADSLLFSIICYRLNQGLDAAIVIGGECGHAPDPDA